MVLTDCGLWVSGKDLTGRDDGASPFIFDFFKNTLQSVLCFEMNSENNFSAVSGSSCTINCSIAARTIPWVGAYSSLDYELNGSESLPGVLFQAAF